MIRAIWLQSRTSQVPKAVFKLFPSRQSSMQAAVQVSREGTRADNMALSKLSATMHGGVQLCGLPSD